MPDRVGGNLISQHFKSDALVRVVYKILQSGGVPLSSSQCKGTNIMHTIDSLLVY